MTSENIVTRKSLRQWESVYLLINTLFIIFIAQRYTFTVDLPASFSSWFYYINISLGHFSFLALLLLGLVFIPLSLLIPHQKILLSVNVVLMTFLITLLGVDTFVFDQYRFHISPFFLKMIIDAGDQVIGFSSLMWLTFISFVSLVLLFQSYLAIITWKKRETLRKILKPGVFFSVTFIMYFVAQFMHIFADANYDQSITRLGRIYPLSSPATAASFLVKHGWAEEGKSQKISIQKSDNLAYPAEKIEIDNTKAPLNILMIVIDSWRYDMMTADITPNIYNFSKQSLVYQQHFSGANATRTGIFSILYGIPGTYWHTFMSNQVSPVLIDSLLERKYQTAVYASAPLINPEFDRTAFVKIPNLNLKTAGKTAYERDEKIVNKWIDWSQRYKDSKPDTPFFGFLFLDSIHAYQYPPDYPRVFTPSSEGINYFTLSNSTDPQPIRNFYQNITHYTDSLVGKIIDDLKAKNMLENTVVIITGDHGQELNDNKQNYWGHNSNFTKYQVQVPFVMRWPGKTADVIAKRTSHYDIVPTLMNHAINSRTAIHDYSTGRDLFDPELKSLDGLVMTNFSMISILDFEKDVMMIKQSGGTISYMDKNYHPVERTPSGSIIKKAVNDMTRFYHK